MKIAVLLTFVLLVMSAESILSPSLTMSWDNWASPTWKPSWLYNTSWVKPQPPLGYTRKNVTAATNTTVREHYAYTPDQPKWPGDDYYCGPVSFLGPNYRCIRNPFFWDPNNSSPECVPDVVTNGMRMRCETATTLPDICCFYSIGMELYSFSLLKNTFPSKMV